MEERTHSSPAPRDKAEFDRFVSASMEGLSLQTASHREMWGLGTAEQWGVDQATGEITFSFPDGRRVTAPVQIIGTFDSARSEWMWAWDNPSVLASMRGDALAVRAYGEERGIAHLTTPRWNATEQDAWAMTALANRLCERNGAYRGPAGPTFVFMTFGEITISKADGKPAGT